MSLGPFSPSQINKARKLPSKLESSIRFASRSVQYSFWPSQSKANPVGASKKKVLRKNLKLSLC